MKKKVMMNLLILVITVTICFSQTFINKEYEFVQWSMPDNWPAYEGSFMPGVAYLHHLR